MALHSARSNPSRRHRESLGHIKMNIDQLDELLERWAQLCDSITISIGDGVTADFVEDLKEISNEELSNLVVRTEDPAIAISLRKYRAKLSYSDDPNDRPTVNAIRQSLKPFKIKVPFMRLRVFWAWIYSLIIMAAFFIDFGLHGLHKPPVPRGSAAYLPPPPPPPPFSTTLLVLLLSTFLLLTAWFIYSYQKLVEESSTKILRKRR